MKRNPRFIKYTHKPSFIKFKILTLFSDRKGQAWQTAQVVALKGMNGNQITVKDTDTALQTWQKSHIHMENDIQYQTFNRPFHYKVYHDFNIDAVTQALSF